MRNIKNVPAPAAAPVSAKPARTIRKPGKAAPAAVAKPAAPAADTARSARQAVLDKARTAVAAFYNGASLTVHKHKPASLDKYAAVCLSPVHKISATGGPSERDHSLLALLAANSDKAGHFDPVALAADAGVISRLASVSFVQYDAKTKAFSLTATGRERAAVIAKRKA